MSHSPLWTSVGINGETGFIQLLFEPFSKSLIAHFLRGLEDGYQVKSLYARHISEDKHHRVTEETDKLSFDCLALSPTSPHVYVNVLETCKLDGKYCGYDWHSIRKINITNNEVVSIIENGNLPIEKPYFRGWVSEIYGVSADGEAVHCSLALEQKTGEQSTIVDYHVAKLVLSDNKYEIITKLDMPFL